MSLVQINRNPTDKMLRQFGLSFPLLALVFGTIIGFAFGLWWVLALLLVLSLVPALIGWLRPRALRGFFIGWLIFFFPLNWLITHLVLAGMFYLLFTPIGLLMRLLGRDPLTRKLDSDAKTYWLPHAPPTSSSRYFRQF